MRTYFVTAIITFMAVPLTAQTAASAPDVYLVTIDTLRADHIHCYGDANIQTPALDALAQAGIRFDQAFTPSPLTNTAHTSILTGLLPSAHGVTDFGIPLPASIPTWAELLKQHGYQTAAFIGAVVLDAHTLAPGLDRGFDFYDNFPTESADASRWGRLERRGGDVVARAQTWMDAHPNGPRFVWVHLYDPHDPYEPPAPYAQTYHMHPYDGEIAYADHALGELVAYLQRTGRYDRSLIAVLGDHGEGLGEHGEQTHGIFLYDSTTHVPLLLKLPENHGGGQVVSAQVQTTDLLPTVLDLLGIAPPAALKEHSLRPYLGATQPTGRVVFGETDYPLRFGWAALRAARSDGFKLIAAPEPELYDLAGDPRERTNVYQPGNAQVLRMRAEIAASAMRSPSVTSLPDPKGKIEEQNLLHTSMMLADENQPEEARATLKKLLLLDPNLAVALRQMGELAFKDGDYRTAADCFGRVLGAHADDDSSALFDAKALARLGDVQPARKVLDGVVTRSPKLLEARLLLADLNAQVGDRAAAQDQWEAVLLLDPANHEALLRLARMEFEEKRFAEVVDLLAPYAPPSGGELTQLLIDAYRQLGRSADADKLRHP